LGIEPAIPHTILNKTGSKKVQYVVAQYRFLPYHGIKAYNFRMSEIKTNRRNFLRQLITLLVLPWSFSIRTAGAAVEELLGRVKRPRSYWKPLISQAAYDVLFKEETERAYSSPLYNEYREGHFVCAACYLPLFDSDKKYESGTGWPSFWQVLPAAVETKTDHSLFLQERTEYHCARCGGHHGHVFDDGPNPTGLRYCNNGVVLRFVPKAEALPELRG